MAIHKVPYAPSKTVYAFDLSSFTIDQHNRATLQGIWVKKKSGVLTISEGQISNVLRGDEPRTLESFMQNFDSRYGGWPDYTWDGTYMNAREKPLAAMVLAAERLTPMLEALSDVPPGLDGWYALR